MKTTLRHRELEELLTPTEVPEPPAGLAERIKAEIPAPLRLAEAGEAAKVVRPPTWRRLSPLLAAASVAALALGGYLAVRLAGPASAPGQPAGWEAAAKRDRRAGAISADAAAAELRDAAQAAPGEGPPVADPEAGRREEAERRLQRLRQEATPPEAAARQPEGRWAERQAAAGAASAFRQPARVPLPEGERAEPRAALRAELERRRAVARPEPPASPAAAAAPEPKEEEVITVTAESPLLDERKLAAGRAVSSSELEKIPTAREPWQVLKQSPGVLVDRVNVGGNEGGTASVPGTAPAEIPKVDRSIESGKTPGAGPLGYDALRLDAESRDAGGEAAGVPGRAAAGEPGGSTQAPSTGGTEEPNDLPYGDVFFREYGVNPFLDAEEDRLSTFGLDVDTGSYTVVRRYLTDGHLPPREAVRIEELVNFFRYGDPAPAGRSAGDFALFAEGAPTPFAAGERYRVLRLAVRGREIAAADRKSAVLTFVVDVSGSMNQDNRLGLVKRALALLLAELSRQDRVGLVVYGSRGRVLLEPTSDLEAIRAAIAGLSAEGSTNAEEGLRLGFEVASRHFRPGAINRLILCSDGVANVGATGPESILARVEAEARRGIELTTVGFGMGNYNDVLMEQLADRGDGRYAYVDDLGEARRIFVEELTGTLETIASDAKAQVEFNPQVVSRWRLLGYENRDIADERFRDDTVDAGEIGAGHWVTALYEVKLQPEARRGAVLATLRLRWRSKAAGEVVEQERELPVGDLAGSWEGASPALRLASLVAEFGEVLKGSFWARQGSMAEVFRRAQRVVVDFPGDASVAEFASLAGRAAELLPSQPAPAPEGER